MKLKASVIVSTRNRGDVLEENIESLLAQAYEAFELIYVDDGSTDVTPEILRRYEARVTICRSDGVGPGMARNVGVELATGDILLFIDDDASAPPNWIADMIRVAEEAEATVLCGGVDPHSMDDPFERYMHYRMQTSLGPIAKEIKAGPTLSMLVRADTFRAVGGFREERISAAEDWDLCLRIGRAGHRIYYSPEPTVIHRYQTDLEGVKRRIVAGARAGVHIAPDHYASVFAYVAYSSLRFVTCVAWVPKAYPKDLRGLAYSMEWLFCKERLGAYGRKLMGRSAL